jgi:hypothetical protein
MKSLALAIQKIWPMLKFLKSGSNFTVKVTRSNILVPIERLVIRNTHTKYESPITCHSKDMANVKVFADRQIDKQTDRQAKNYISPIFRYGGMINVQEGTSRNSSSSTHWITTVTLDKCKIIRCAVPVFNGSYDKVQ